MDLSKLPIVAHLKVYDVMIKRGGNCAIFPIVDVNRTLQYCKGIIAGTEKLKHDVNPILSVK